MIGIIAIYLFPGALLWMLLDGAGQVSETLNRKQTTLSHAVLATVMFIVLWPLFVFRWLSRMRRVAR